MTFKSVKIETLNKKQSQNIDLEYVGRGGFATVYKNLAGMIISFVDIDDTSRNYISAIKSKYIPNIAFLGAYYVNSEVKNVYISELYYSADNNFLAQELSCYFYNFADKFEGKIKDHNRMLVEYLESKINNSERINAIKEIVNSLLQSTKMFILEFQINNLMTTKTAS